MYNEPDISDAGVDFGGCWGRGHPRSASGAGGAAYAQMMAVAYPAIKAGYANAIVMNGGLAYDFWYNPSNGSGRVDPNFVDEFLAAGGGHYVDTINFHYYPAFANNWKTADRYGSDIVGKANALAAKFAAAGVGRPLAVTETGWPTTSAIPNGSDRPDRYVTQVYVRGMSRQIYPISWFTLVDYPYPLDPYYYGLITSSLQPKQAYYAYRTLTSELDGYSFVRVRRGFAPSLEGYDFARGDSYKTVVWALQAQPVAWDFAVAEPGGVLRVVSHTGNVSQISDGGSGDADGRVDGHVQISIGQDPLYLQGLATTLGSVSGVVYHDINGNRQRDGGDTPLAGAKVGLYSNTGWLIDTQTTAASGAYSFSDLDPGAYRLDLTPPPGFALSTPPPG